MWGSVHGLYEPVWNRWTRSNVVITLRSVVEMRGGVRGLNPPNVQESVQILEIWKQMCKF